MRDLLTMLYALALALGLGIYSADQVSAHFDGFGALSIGQWMAHPEAGTAAADPYARASAARTAQLPLGTSEGIRFTATLDTEGRRLSGYCSYVLEGRMPSNRLWTLRLTDDQSRSLEPRPPVVSRIHSRAVVRDTNSSIVISLADMPDGPNWLHLDHDGTVNIVLTLYDSTIVGASTLTDVTMPEVRRTGCRS